MNDKPLPPQANAELKTRLSGQLNDADSRFAVLMAQAQDGDAKAYRQLLGELSTLAKSFAGNFSRKAGGGIDIDDASQEILLAVHAKRHTFDASRSFFGWFYAIARYKLIDGYRARRKDSKLVPIDDSTLEIAALEEEPLTSQDVETLLAQVSEKQREAIRLVKLEGLTALEAARVLGVSESDVKVSIHRGLKKLRERTEKDGRT